MGLTCSQFSSQTTLITGTITGQHACTELCGPMAFAPALQYTWTSWNCLSKGCTSDTHQIPKFAEMYNLFIPMASWSSCFHTWTWRKLELVTKKHRKTMWLYIYIMMQESVFKSRNQTQPWLQPSNRSNRSYIDPSDSAAWRHHLSFDRLAEVGSQLNGPLNRPAQIRGIPWWKSSQNHHKWHVSRIGKEHPDGILDGILDGTMTSIWSKLIHKNSWFKVPHSFANCPAPKFWHRAAKVCWLCVQLVHQDISDLMGFTAVPARGPIRVTAVTVRSSEHWTSAISLVWKAPACFKTTQSLAKLASMPSDTMKSGNFMEFPYPEGHWLQFRRF